MSFVVRFFFSIFLAVLPATAAADPSATSLLSSGHIDDAISTLHQTISRSPQDAEAHNLLCRAYFSMAEWDRSIADCEKAVSLDPNNSNYHLWLGRAYGEKADKANFLSAAGLAKKTRVELENAVQLDPKNVAALTDLAEFYLEAPGIVGGGREKAEAEARTLEALDPARADWVYARIAEKKKDFSAAEKYYRAAIQVGHGAASTWLNLGLFYKHANRLDEMQEALHHVLAAPVDRPEALFDAAEILTNTGRNPSDATELLKRYLSSGDSVEQAPAFKAHYLLGTVLEKQGAKQAAAREYRVALELAKNYLPAQEALNRINH
ncbi:MAG TPA: tetratricopeptide repeat protein [Terriglobales bacterium]|nr:tetratricopeptide repeat protein [Terriglobales bacterium]